MLRGMTPNEASDAFTKILFFILAYQLALVLATLGNFIASAIAAIHAAKRRETAWTLVIIFFPFIGWIAYWLRGNDGTDGIQYVKAGPVGPAGQIGRTEADVANEVSAAISEEIKQRRIQRGR